MHLKCIQSGLNVPRDTVYDLMKLLDPEKLLARRRNRLRRRVYVSKGPNYVLHIDSYDKLKPYDIAINGRIDGLSRNVIWLEANTTNSALALDLNLVSLCVYNLIYNMVRQAE